MISKQLSLSPSRAGPKRSVFDSFLFVSLLGCFIDTNAFLMTADESSEKCFLRAIVYFVRKPNNGRSVVISQYVAFTVKRRRFENTCNINGIVTQWHFQTIVFFSFSRPAHVVSSAFPPSEIDRQNSVFRTSEKKKKHVDETYKVKGSAVTFSRPVDVLIDHNCRFA